MYEENMRQRETREKAEQTARWKAEAAAEFEAELKKNNGDIELTAARLRTKSRNEHFAEKAAEREQATATEAAKEYARKHPAEMAAKAEVTDAEIGLATAEKSISKARAIYDAAVKTLQGAKGK